MSNSIEYKLDDLTDCDKLDTLYYEFAETAKADVKQLSESKLREDL